MKFVGPSYALNHRKADVQRLVNLHVVMQETPGGKSAAYLDSTPGLSTFSAAISAVTAQAGFRSMFARWMGGA